MMLKIKKLNEAAKIPTRGTKGAACFDLYCTEDVFIGSGDTKGVPTGLAFEVPEGYCMTVYSRSSSFAKLGLTIVPLIVDSDYRGEVLVFARYEERYPGYRLIKKGDRIAQFKLEKLEDTTFEVVDELGETKTVWHRVQWDDERGIPDEIPNAGPILVTTRHKEVAVDVAIVTENGVIFDFYGESVVAWAEMPDPYKEN